MRVRNSILSLSIFLISFQLKSQVKVEVNIPTAEKEAEYIWQTIQDINFFEKNKYEVSLPNGLLIDELKEKSKQGNLKDEDYKQLEKFIKDSIYNENDYKQGYEKIANQLPLINQLISKIDTSRFNWTFKKFDTYKVNLTLYGPGGSFNPDEGSILIYTTPKGEFKNYSNPANTIIHEIVHIGIEESIISKYSVPHVLKERIVDTFVSLYFKEYLPEYNIQDMGEYRTDKYLKSTMDFKKLDEIVVKILSKE